MGRLSILRIWSFRFRSLRRWGLRVRIRVCCRSACERGSSGRVLFEGGIVTIKTISSREVYRNPWTSVREDVIERSNGERGIYGVVDKDPACIVIPLDVGAGG